MATHWQLKKWQCRLGRVTLPSTLFHEDGFFDGELQLLEAGKRNQAFLRVRVEINRGEAARSPEQHRRLEQPDIGAPSILQECIDLVEGRGEPRVEPSVFGGGDEPEFLHRTTSASAASVREMMSTACENDGEDWDAAWSEARDGPATWSSCEELMQRSLLQNLKANLQVTVNAEGYKLLVVQPRGGAGGAESV